MTVHITTSNFPLTKDDEEFISRRLVFAINRFGRHIRRVNVHVTITTEAKRARQTQVRLQAMLQDGESILIEDINNELFSATAIAADRLARRLDREFHKRVEVARTAATS